MPMSVRLDAKTERLVERLARARGQTKSEVVRDAIGALVKETQETAQAVTPYERVKDLVGCVSGGPRDLSERTGEKFRQLLISRGG